MLSVDTALAQLAAEGQIDSRGRFTLDPRLAAQKLSQFTSSDPHRYALHLVAFAVSAGAEQIQIKFQGGVVSFEFGAPPPELGQLQLAWSAPLVSPAPPTWVLELSLALHSLSKLRVKKIELRAPGARLELSRKYFSVSPDGASSTEPWSLRVDFGGWKRPLRSLLRLSHRETSLWEQRCLYCPIPILLEGCLLNCAWPHNFLAGFCERSLPDIGLELPWQAARPWGWGVAISSAWPSLEHNLEVVLNGVSFCQDWGESSYRYLIFSRTLQKDISQEKLVVDDLFRQMLQEVGQLAPQAT